MTYQDRVSMDIEAIDQKLDEIEELLLGLPIRVGQKNVIQRMIYEIYSEIENAVEVSAVDFE